MKIPLDSVDTEIRKLVRLVNSFEGLRTTDSCAGHKEGETCYISIVAESQERLATLIKALPFRGVNAGIVANMPFMQTIWIGVVIYEDGNLHYVLNMQGYPFYEQRRLIVDVEQCLEKHLANSS